ncbi:MAG: PAS domain S-box protein [Gracilimonas sp.]|uniref:PAS domain S-box protein n=1 Tax=Gracilimonas TaxID=649462 RepID=UPI001B1344AE|nr:PAS domain S-box protein [Gracilimonas sp.]MBO6586051.1 PAS domain S-box protein [Gracilimonas sp.]MBO6617048.1 PAS domain S-box protein [Gracilimonas sp.]
MGKESNKNTGLRRHHFFSAFNSIPDAMVVTDINRRIISVNSAFVKLFGYKRGEVKGKETSILYSSEQDFSDAGEARFNPDSDVKAEVFEVLYRRKNGEIFPAESVGSVVKDDDGETIGYLAAIKDLTREKRRSEEISLLTKRLRLVAAIVANEEKNFEAKIKNALKLTTDLLGFEIGIVSRIEGETYTIKHYYPETADLEEGMEFDLSQTYCSITLKSDDVVCINEMRTSPYKAHPCYSKFSLESYIGVPLIVDEEAIGTINFSSSESRTDPLNQADRDMVRLLGQWLSSEFQKQAYQDELKQSRDRFRLISHNSADLVCLHKPDGSYEYLSPSAEKILGYSPEELIGKSPYELFHPEDLKRIQEESHEKALKGEHIHHIHYRIKRKDGEYIWFETATEPILNDEGEVDRLQTSSREITERKKLENLLKDTNKLASVGGWELDLKNQDLYWTDEVYRIHELPLGSELNVEEAINFYAEEDQPTITEAVSHAIQTGEGYDLELTLVTAKGNRKWVRAIGKTQMDENGEAYKLYGVFQDLSMRKLMEDQLKEKNEKLEQLLKATNDINAIIGHDLKSPLNTIIGFSDLSVKAIEEGAFEAEKFKKFLTLIYTSSKGMSTTLDDLLKWSRLQTGDLNLDITSIDIKRVGRNLSDFFQASLSNKGLTLKFDFGEHSQIRADESMITTMIRNLISNAIKFSNEKGEITVRLEKLRDDWVLTVQDEGVGMTDEVKRDLFSPLNHPSEYGTKNEKGTGLGLKVTEKLVKLHGGRVEVESEVGKGTRFKLYIPNDLSPE